jgi:hypothetical protein
MNPGISKTPKRKGEEYRPKDNSDLNELLEKLDDAVANPDKFSLVSESISQGFLALFIEIQSS